MSVERDDGSPSETNEETTNILGKSFQPDSSLPEFANRVSGDAAIQVIDITVEDLENNLTN